LLKEGKKSLPSMRTTRSIVKNKKSFSKEKTNNRKVKRRARDQEKKKTSWQDKYNG